MEYLTPTSTLMQKVGEFKDKNRGHEHFNHLTAMAEGMSLLVLDGESSFSFIAVQILGWVAVEPAPAPFAKEMVGGAQFWTNKILKEFRGKCFPSIPQPYTFPALTTRDSTQEAFVSNLTDFLKGIPPYIIQHHTTGLTWGK